MIDANRLVYNSMLTACKIHYAKTKELPSAFDMNKIGTRMRNNSSYVAQAYSMTLNRLVRHMESCVSSSFPSCSCRTPTAVPLFLRNGSYMQLACCCRRGGSHRSSDLSLSFVRNRVRCGTWWSSSIHFTIWEYISVTEGWPNLPNFLCPLCISIFSYCCSTSSTSRSHLAFWYGQHTVFIRFVYCISQILVHLGRISLTVIVSGELIIRVFELYNT